ncbi:MAG: hypothetical protein SOW92_07280 [Kiritimatiellia bacterium]|nr:hypothetical protein [Kiritimatiellia bacterium]
MNRLDEDHGMAKSLGTIPAEFHFGEPSFKVLAQFCHKSLKEYLPAWES